MQTERQRVQELTEQLAAMRTRLREAENTIQQQSNVVCSIIFA